MTWRCEHNSRDGECDICDAPSRVIELEEEVTKLKEDLEFALNMGAKNFMGCIQAADEIARIREALEEGIRLCNMGCVEGEMRENSFGDMAQKALISLEKFANDKKDKQQSKK